MSVRRFCTQRGAYPSLTIAGCRSREISGYVLFIWINTSLFYDRHYLFSPLRRSHSDRQTQRHYSRKNNPRIVLLETGRRLVKAHMPMTCLRAAGAGQEAIVFTHFVVREDAQLPYDSTISKSARYLKELLKRMASGLSWRWRSSPHVGAAVCECG